MPQDKLFNNLVNTHKNKFNQTFFYGIPINQLSGDNLRAIICEIGAQQICDKEDRDRERDMFNFFLHKKSNIF